MKVRCFLTLCQQWESLYCYYMPYSHTFTLLEGNTMNQDHEDNSIVLSIKQAVCQDLIDDFRPGTDDVTESYLALMKACSGWLRQLDSHILSYQLGNLDRQQLLKSIAETLYDHDTKHELNHLYVLLPQLGKKRPAPKESEYKPLKQLSREWGLSRFTLRKYLMQHKVPHKRVGQGLGMILLDGPAQQELKRHCFR